MSETGGSSFRTAPGLPVRPQPKSVDDKLRDASKMYEKMFLREMVKAMRSTVPESGFIKQNAAEKLFRDEMDQENVNNWANHQSGVGLADLIYNNLIEKYGAQLGLKEPVQKPRGPIALNEESRYAGPTRIPAARPSETTYRFDRRVDSAEGGELLAPWSGTITEKRDLGDGATLLGLSHDHGLSGKFVFRGTAERLNLGQSVQGGERIGLLSPEAKAFFWTLGVESAPGAEKGTDIVSE